MNAQIRNAVALMVRPMLVAQGIDGSRIDLALDSFFRSLDGEAQDVPMESAVSRKEAARRLGASVMTITRLVKRGQLRGIYGGERGERLTAVSGESLRQLLAGRAASEHAKEVAV